MSRRYSDRIRVVLQPGTDPDSDPVEPQPPRSFAWRGRSYRVVAVLARWVEAEQWWRTAGFGGGVAADSTVWRVEAVSGSAVAGVFDLRHRTGAERSDWFLVRAFD